MHSQTIQTSRHPEPKEILVESIPVKEGTKLSMDYSWEDLRGLSWIQAEEWGTKETYNQ